MTATQQANPTIRMIGRCGVSRCRHRATLDTPTVARVHRDQRVWVRDIDGPGVHGWTRRDVTEYLPVRHVAGVGPVNFHQAVRYPTYDVNGQSYDTGAPMCPEHAMVLMWRQVEATVDTSVRCGGRCAAAYGPVCVCSCGGANHGERYLQ